MKNAETLRRDGDFLLSRCAATEVRSGCLMLVASDPPASRHVRRLEHEYALRDQLDFVGAVRPIALLEDAGRPALMLEDPGGRLLAELVGEPWDIATFLRVAIGLASALGRVHERGLVHKDVNPANVLIDVATGDAWLLGFGIASRLPRERRASEPPLVIEGTLPYMAPEQTGRMNRSIDSRADLYSLGITLFEMLTGELPFAASDLMEWMHCHLARQAPRADHRSARVPAQIAAIVEKLLAKPAESRYQTAEGVEADLRRCQRTLETTGRIDSFRLGAGDILQRLLIPEKLYGREGDIETLLAAYERVAQSGEGETVFVSGYAGIGKSSVVNEAQRAFVSSRSLFAAGKFDQYQRDVPYATLAQALETLSHTILAQSESEVAEWRAALTRALGQNGRVVTELVPELELIIGPQPPVPELAPGETQSRFQMVLRQLLGAFARPGRPLVLFFDDLQWLDAATLKLLEMLVANGKNLPLLLLGAYRSNEVHAAHPLTAVLDTVRKTGPGVHLLELGALRQDHVTELVVDALGSGPQAVSSLSQAVHDKTDGNPFFTIEFLHELAHERMLRFEAGAGTWEWDAERIQAKGYTDNVASLMATKLTRLAPRALETLKDLACLGNPASLATLALVRCASEAATETELWDAVLAGIVLRAGAGYAFSHDRVQEAAYALIAEPERSAAHLRIGRLLASTMGPEAAAEKVFEVVSQLNRAVDLVERPEERAMLRRLNVQAGNRAKSAIAYSNARSYLALAATLLPPDTWGTLYEETFDLYLALAECEFLTGHFDVADELFETILKRARSNVDRATATCVRLQLYEVAGSFAAGCAAACDTLQLFGVRFPEDDAEMAAEVDSEYRLVPRLLADRAIADVARGPAVTDPTHRAVMDLLVYAAPCAFIGSPRIFPLLTLKAVTLSLGRGNTDVSCRAYAAFATMLVAIYGDIPRAIEFSEMALCLNDNLGKPRDRGSLLMMHGHMVAFWRHPFATAVPIQDQAFTACLQVGDLAYAGYVAFLSVWQLLEKGDSLDDVLAGSAKFAAFARQTSSDTIYQTIRLEQQFVLSLQAKTVDPLGMTDASFDESTSFGIVERATFGTGIALYHVMKEILAFHQGRYEQALAAARAIEPYLAPIMSLAVEATHRFYHALTSAALSREANAQDKEKYATVLADAAKRFQTWAEHSPDNFGARRSLLLAEMARLEARDRDAMRLYEDAIRSARKNRCIKDEALALELSGAFFEEYGFETAARALLQDAYHRYMQWGANAKVDQLARSRPYLAGELAPPPAMTAGRTSVEHLDLTTVVRVLQTLSGEIDLERWVDQMMKIALEDAGARRGVLLVAEGDDQRTLAEATADRDGILVRLCHETDDSPPLPDSVLRYVARTHETVLLGDALAAGPFSTDSYFAGEQSRSVLCLPLVKQNRLTGILYLENDLAPNAFTSRRVALLRLLVSQAAISLENARLHTDLRREEAALQNAQAELARVMRSSALGELAGSIAHEVNQPPGAIRMNVRTTLNWLKHEPPLMSNAFASLAAIAADSERAGQIIARIYALLSRSPFRRAPCDVNDLVSGVLPLVRAQFQGQHVALEVALADEVPLILGDTVQLQQVLLNLLLNAADACKEFEPERRRVLVRTSSERRDGRSWAIVAVDDVGKGIDPATAGRMFDAFYSTKPGGLGMGLSISRSIVLRHDGQLTAATNSPHGATFELRIPASA